MAIVAKGILSALLVFHSDSKGHLHISFADKLLFVCFAPFALIYVYAHQRAPRYYEAIEGWGELIEDDLILTFNANLHNFELNERFPVSIRFWPFLVIAAMWIHFFARLQLHRSIGAYVILMRQAGAELTKFLGFWFVSLAFFACVTTVWLGEYQNYGSFSVALETLYLGSFGLRDLPAELPEHRQVVVKILHAAFVIVNLIGFLSFLTAMMTQTLVQSRS